MIKSHVGEEWRPVVGFDGYVVSNHGRVGSFRCRVPGCGEPLGWTTSDELQRILKPATHNGRKGVNLMGRDGNPHFMRVSNLVLEAFVGPKPEGMECCHWDNDPENNHIENLRWDTHEGNFLDRHNDKEGGADAFITGMREDYAAGMSAEEVAKKYNFSTAYIYQICSGKAFKAAGGPITTGPRKVTNSQRERLIEDYKTGEYLMKELAEMYGCSISWVSRIVNNKMLAADR